MAGPEKSIMPKIRRVTACSRNKVM